MLLTILSSLALQAAEPQWREFKAHGWSARLSAEDLEMAARARREAAARLDEAGDPLPWYVSVRTLASDPDGAPEVKRVGYVCGRGHVDDEDGLTPITPHTMPGEIYDLVCFGDGETSPWPQG